MVVDHIENDAQAGRMRTVHKLPEVVGFSVEPGRSVEVYPVVTPAEAAGEFRNRHDLKKGNAHFRQVGKIGQSASPCPFFCECPDMHLIYDLSRQCDAAPFRVRPFETSGMDDLRRSGYTFRLK